MRVNGFRDVPSPPVHGLIVRLVSSVFIYSFSLIHHVSFFFRLSFIPSYSPGLQSSIEPVTGAEAQAGICLQRARHWSRGTGEDVPPASASLEQRHRRGCASSERVTGAEAQAGMLLHCSQLYARFHGQGLTESFGSIVGTKSVHTDARPNTCHLLAVVQTEHS
jgi:hypothetical protein